MPIPKPNKNEKRKDFLSRCMSNPTMRNEYEDIDQRYAVCNTQWRNKNKKKSEEDEEEKEEK